MYYEAIGLRAQNVLLIVGSTGNIMRGRGGGLYDLSRKKNFHFDNKKYTVRKVIIFCLLIVQYPRRSGRGAKNAHFGPAYCGWKHEGKIWCY